MHPSACKDHRCSVDQPRRFCPGSGASISTITRQRTRSIVKHRKQCWWCDAITGTRRITPLPKEDRRLRRPGPAVISVDPRTDPRWRVLAAGPKGSLFTSPPWMRAVCDTYGFTPQARITADADGHPTGGFAWVPVSDMCGDRLVSLPFSDRAEPLITDAAQWPYLALDAVGTDVPLKIRCLDGSSPTCDPRFVRIDESAWHCTPLDAPLSEIRSSFRPATRRNIATAERRGVHVDASTGMAAVRTYHRLHVSLRKHKYRLLAQPVDFFERIWQEFSAHDGIVTFLAYVDGEPVAGAVYLVWNDVLYYKFGASLPATLPLRPNDAVTWSALQWAAERGFRVVDWGLSALDQQGLVAYKRKWASAERRIVTVCTQHIEGSGTPNRVLGELTDLLTEDSVPDHVTERAGALLYRYFA